MSVSLGEQLYDARTEYPLPAARGSGFVFYYVPDDNDDFSRLARQFLKRVYPDPTYTHNRASSLADVIDQVHGAITNGTVDRISEIMLVGHANPHELHLPIIPAASAFHTVDGESAKVDAFWLRELQTAFNDGSDPEMVAFNEQRKVVVAHMTRDSAVTIRACRFGLSDAGMFALYSFFGGHANVYAPKTYMVFSKVPVRAKTRFETMSDVYEHMASQRLVSRRRRTPGRQEAIVTMIAEPGVVSETITVLEADLSQPGDAADRYRQAVTELNSGRVPEPLRASLHGELDIDLAPASPVSLGAGESNQVTNGAGALARTQWVIRDRLPSELDVLDPTSGVAPRVVFYIEVTVSDLQLAQQSSLVVEAGVIERTDAITAPASPKRNRVFLQLFVNEVENKRKEGIEGELATGLVDSLIPWNLAQLAQLAQLEVALDTLTAGPDGTAEGIVREAIPWDVELEPGPLVITEQPVSVKKGRNGVTKIWRFAATEFYDIEKLERTDVLGRRERVIHLRKHFEKDADRREHESAVSYDVQWGANPDVPGTELMSYLDGLSADELMALIDYIDSVHDARRTEMGPVWRHAMAALQEKKDLTYLVALSRVRGDKGDPLLGITGPYFDQSYAFDNQSGSLLQLHNTAYPFNSVDHWARPRESQSPSTPPIDDLFSEQRLPKAPAYLNASRISAPADVVAFERSPLADLDQPKIAKITGTKSFQFREVVDQEELDCVAFKQALSHLSNLSELSGAELDAALAALTEIENPADPTLYKAMERTYKIMRLFFEDLPAIPWSKTELAKKLVARFPRLAFGPPLAPTLVRYARTYSFLSVIGHAGLWIFEHLLHDAGIKRATGVGEGAGIALREYARHLRAYARQHPTDFPTAVPFSIRNPPNIHGLYLYHLGFTGSHANWFPPLAKDLLDGFERGAKIAEKFTAWELLWAPGRKNRRLRGVGLTECMIKALDESQLVGDGRIRAMAAMEIADALDEAARASLTHLVKD